MKYAPEITQVRSTHRLWECQFLNCSDLWGEL